MKNIQRPGSILKGTCLLIALFGGSAASNGATLSFDIVLNYVNAPTLSQQAAFNSAEATWESIIKGYSDTVAGTTKLTIDVTLENIDGAGGTLGSAGPTGGIVTTNFLYATTGGMTFDTSDTAALELNGTFDDVVLHEMGHVIGIGTLWSASAATGGSVIGRQEVYTVGSGQYTGAFGVAAYNAEFSQVGVTVPVELGGGSGTANGHWNEVDGGAGPTGIVSNITGQDFRDELMTGWLNSNPFISNLTKEGMRDIGYIVVPEPSAMLLLVVGCLPLLRRNKR